MGKIEVKRLSYLSEQFNDCEKETFLRELSQAVHHYIKTGIRNKQLDDLLALEEKFQKKYEQRFDINCITDMIYETSKDKLINSKQYHIQLNIGNCLDEEQFMIQVEKTSQTLAKISSEIVYEKLNSILKDAAYLSHMNMLYELYEKEEKLRREEKEFEEISQKYKKMAEITQKLSKKRRMELREVEEIVDITKLEIKQILQSCGKFFNIRDKKEQIQVSLSPTGKRYNEYISRINSRYSSETLNHLVYKNCNNLLEAMENSCNRLIRYDFRLEGIEPDKERAIAHRYNRMLQKIMSDNETVYTIKDYKVIEKKVSVKNNEENRFTIPEEWDTGVY